MYRLGDRVLVRWAGGRGHLGTVVAKNLYTFSDSVYYVRFDGWDKDALVIDDQMQLTTSQQLIDECRKRLRAR
jgi:hypothetical protein